MFDGIIVMYAKGDRGEEDARHGGDKDARRQAQLPDNPLRDDPDGFNISLCRGDLLIGGESSKRFHARCSRCCGQGRQAQDIRCGRADSRGDRCHLVPDTAKHQHAEADAGACLVANSKYECISALALKSYNASMCGSLSWQYANRCYDKVALASKNATVCGGITDRVEGSVCAASIAEATETMRHAKGGGATCRRARRGWRWRPNLASAGNSERELRGRVLLDNKRAEIADGDRSFAPCMNVTGHPRQELTVSIIENISGGRR